MQYAFHYWLISLEAVQLVSEHIKEARKGFQSSGIFNILSYDWMVSCFRKFAQCKFAAIVQCFFFWNLEWSYGEDFS